MESIKNSQWRGNRACNAPKHNVIIVELNRIHVVFFDAKSIGHPKTNVDKNQQRNERSSRFALPNMTVSREHFAPVYDEYGLNSRLDESSDLNGERELLDVSSQTVFEHRYDCIETEQVNAC